MFSCQRMICESSAWNVYILLTWYSFLRYQQRRTYLNCEFQIPVFILALHDRWNCFCAVGEHVWERIELKLQRIVFNCQLFRGNNIALDLIQTKTTIYIERNTINSQSLDNARKPYIYKQYPMSHIWDIVWSVCLMPWFDPDHLPLKLKEKYVFSFFLNSILISYSIFFFRRREKQRTIL